MEVAAEILTYCIEAGGSLTGEHGIGADKSDYMPRMFSPDDLALMQRVRAAIDPRGLCNPGKVFPTPRLCGEVPGPYRKHPIEEAGLGERCVDRRRTHHRAQDRRRGCRRPPECVGPETVRGDSRRRHEDGLGTPAETDRRHSQHARG